MRRITDEEIPFYDRIAERISNALGSANCPLTQGSLAKRIGWNRPSLCNFINRIDKGIAAHFIPRIARVLGVSMEHLINGDQLQPRQRNLWDPRFDETELFLEKCHELRQRKLHSYSLMSVLPLQVLPHHAMVANFVNAMVNGASPVVAERWHEAIEGERARLLDDGCDDVDYLIPMADLLRLANRTGPYQAFSSDEVVQILENLKREWVKKRGMRIIALEDTMLNADMRLELSGNIILSVLGREIQLRFHKDLRIDWDDASKAVDASRDCLIKLKRAAGFGVRDRPTADHVEQLINGLTKQAESCARPTTRSVRMQFENGSRETEQNRFALR